MKPTLGHQTHWSRCLLSLAAAAMVLGCCLPKVSGQTTWTGGDDATWSSAANWTNGVPGTTTDVIFGAPVPGTGSIIVLGAGSVANSLSIQDSYTFNDGTLTLANGAIHVAAGKTFTVNTALAGTGNFTLTGEAGSEGIFAGGMTQTGDTLDLSVNSGTWTHLSGTSRIADDVTVTGAGTVLNLDGGLFLVRDDFIVRDGAVLNLNATSVLSFSTPTLSADAILYMRNGAVVNLGAHDAVVATDFDRLYLAQDAGGATVVLNMSTFNLSTNRLILGERAADRNGVITGTGTLMVIGGDYDLYEGTIHANLASTGTLAFEKFGPGTVTLKGDNSGLTSTGASVLNEGTLVLDYTANNATKLREQSVLNLRTGTLKIVGNESAATTQEVASLSLTSGGLSVIDMNSGTGQTATLKLNAVARTNSQGTLRLNLNDAGATVATTTTNAAHGLIGVSAFATVKDGTGTWFATVDGASNIVAMISTAKNDVSTWTAADHATDSGAGYSGTVANAVLNSLRFDAPGGSEVNIQAGGSLSIASGGVLVTDQVTGGAPGIFGGTLSSGSGELIVTHDSVRSFEISSQITGTQAVTKTGEGTLILSGNNSYAGQTQIQAGTVVLVGGNAIGDTSLVTLANGRDTTLQLTADETIGRLQGGRRNTNSDYGTVAIGDHTLTLNQSANTAFAGVFTGTGTIVMNAGSVGNLNMTGVSTGFTGSVVINGGLFQLSGASRNNAGSFTINKGGSLLIDKNGSTRSSDQILNTAEIILNSADGGFSGTTINRPRGLGIRTDQESTNTELVGVVTVNSGGNYVTLEATTANDDPDLQMVNLVRNTGATLNVRGTNLGVATSNVQRAQFEITNSTNQTAFIAAMVGGSGAAGSSNVKIVPWAIGESFSGALTDTNMGNSLVTYVAGAGFRPLDFATEYASFATAGDTNNTRESLTADLTGLSGRTVNAIVLHNDSTAAATRNVTGSGASQTLTVTSGAMLFTLNPSAAAGSYGIHLGGFDGGIAVGGTNEYVIHVVDPDAATPAKTLTATISSPLNTAGASLTKAGRGTLVLTADNTNLGAIYIAEGMLQIGSGGTTGSLSGTSSISNLGMLVFNRSDTLTQGVHFGTEISGFGGLWQMGSGTTVLNGNNTSTGATVIDQGVLRLDSAYHPANSLLMGSVNGLTTAGTLEVNEGATFGSLLVQTNSSTATNNLVVAAGKTLAVNGAVTIGANAAASSTLLAATGGGSFVNINQGGVFQVGGATGSSNVNAATADFSGLDSFIVDLGLTGTMRIGDNSSNTGGSAGTSTLVLATDSTITAGTLHVAASQIVALQTLRLGTGVSILNVDTLNVGGSTRGAGLLNFATDTGTLRLRAADGIGAVVMNLGVGTTSTTSNLTGNVNLADHEADLLVSALTMADRSAGTGTANGSVTFSAGVLDAGSVVMARRTGSGTGSATATLDLGGGTATLGSLDMAVNTSGGGTATANLNISGGNVAIGSGSGTAINMANAAASRTATSNINLTGGTVTVAGDIVRTGGAGTENATVTLNGASLDMSGYSIGNATPAITFNAQSGTLANLGELNGGGSLTKTTAGTLVLTGVNTYTGATVINQGVLRLDSVHSMTGALQFGSTSGTTTAGTLEVNDNATFSSLLVQTNSGSNTNQITIAAGKELVVQGNAILGSTTGSSTTLLNVSGPGAWRILNPNSSASVHLGNTATNRSRIDSSGLDTLEVALNTTNGQLRIGSSTSDSSSTYGSWWLLAKNTSITAATLTVGAGGLGSLNELQLGTGSNVIHVNTFNVGTGSRDTGSVFFQDATGTLVVRAADGVGAATFNLGGSGATTGNSNFGNSFDVTGHDVDLLFGAAAIGTQNRGNSISHTLSFDQGMLTMASLTLATRTASSTNGLTNARVTDGTVNLGGGTVVIQNGILNMGRAAGNYYNDGEANYQSAPTMNATINITGGDVTIGATGGVAVRMAEYVATGGSGTGTANGHLNITGGSVTVGGHIIRVTDGVNATATVTLDGGSLDMTGNSIGTAAAPAVTFNAQSGTLANLGELNGGGALTKTSSGTLVLDGANTYTGLTAVDAGTLLVHGTHTGGGMYTVQSGAMLGGKGATTAAVDLAGVLSPGASVGMLATGSQTWNAGAGFLFEINDAAGTGGGPSGWDAAAITGTLDISELRTDAPFVVEIVSLNGSAAGEIANFVSAQPYTWEFVTFDSLIGEFSSDLFTVEHSGFTNDLGQGHFAVVQTANGLAIGFVPEPGAFLLAWLGVMLLLSARKRRRGV